jgi:aminobenzoyl-glutamate transport protein
MPLLAGTIVPRAATINLVIGSASAKWGMLAPVRVPRLMLLGLSPGMTTAAWRMGGLIAAMLPYSLSFLVAGLLMPVGWVALDLAVGPGATIEYTLPDAGRPAGGVPLQP